MYIPIHRCLSDENSTRKLPVVRSCKLLLRDGNIGLRLARSRLLIEQVYKLTLRISSTTEPTVAGIRDPIINNISHEVHPS